MNRFTFSDVVRGVSESIVGFYQDIVQDSVGNLYELLNNSLSMSFIFENNKLKEESTHAEKELNSCKEQLVLFSKKESLESSM